jgi:hypothetical protein
MKISTVGKRYSAEWFLFIWQQTGRLPALMMPGMLFWAAAALIVYVIVPRREVAWIVALACFFIFLFPYVLGFRKWTRARLEKHYSRTEVDREISYEICGDRLVFEMTDYHVAMRFRDLLVMDISRGDIRMQFAGDLFCVIGSEFFRSTQEKEEFLGLLQAAIVAALGEAGYQSALQRSRFSLSRLRTGLYTVMVENGVTLLAVLLFAFAFHLHDRHVSGKMAMLQLKCPEDTRYQIYQRDGHTIETCLNAQRQHEGPFTLWQARPRKSVEGLIHNGLKEGEWTYYYANGQISGRGRFKRDKQDGRWEYWYEDGRYRVGQVYRDGTLVRCLSDACGYASHQATSP